VDEDGEEDEAVEGDRTEEGAEQGEAVAVETGECPP
jgi:hypothetical protein